MKRNLLLLAFLIAFAVATPATIGAQYLHPRISSKETTIRNVVILPPKIQIVRQSMKGPEGMAAESEALSVRVTQLLTDALATKHVTAWSGVLGSGDSQKTYVIADLQSRYDALLPKINKKPKDVKKGRFTLGDEVLNLNLAKTTDAIVFVRGDGQKLSKGKAAFSILTLSLNLPYLRLTIGIVDAHTGEVLLFTIPVAIADVTNEKERALGRAIESSLKKLPPAP
ncbi:MAG TPA: hypothetical protein VK475_09195 [Pyrinomonadaceae bacterium]|nr:hypothetical protein [Pyrinomonadaceae bacterium]